MTTREFLRLWLPALLLAVMAVWAYLVLSDNEALAQDRLVVNVTAQQFAWQFQYPGTNVGSAKVLERCGFVEVERETTDIEEIVYRLA